MNTLFSWIMAVLFVIFPFVIWHDIKRRKKEKEELKKAIAELEKSFNKLMENAREAVDLLEKRLKEHPKNEKP